MKSGAVAGCGLSSSNGMRMIVRTKGREEEVKKVGV